MTLRPRQEAVYRPSQPLLGNLQLSVTAEVGDGVLLPEKAVDGRGSGVGDGGRGLPPKPRDKCVLWSAPHCCPSWANRKVPRAVVGRVAKRERTLS